MTLVGIISFLNSDPKSRKIRADTHLRQLSLIHEYLPECEVMGVYQNWSENELPNVNIKIYHKSGIGAAGARNEILSYFYKSNFDTLLLIDDDRFFYPYYDFQKFFTDCSDLHFGMIRTLDPMISPFKEFNWKNRNIIKDNWILEGTKGIIGGGGLFIIRNLKKYYNREIYFIENTNAGLGQCYDDMNFLLDIVDSDLPVYFCRQLVQKVLLYEDSVIFSDHKQRMSVHKKNIAVTYGWYKNSKHLLLNKLGNIRIIDPPNTKLLNREIPYNYIDRLVYKSKNKSNKKKLF